MPERRQGEWTAVRVHRDTAAALVRLREEWAEREIVGPHARDVRERTGLDRVIRRLIEEVERHRARAKAQRGRRRRPAEGKTDEAQ